MDKIIFEIATPPVTWNSEKIEEWAGRVSVLIRQEGISCINLSEIVEEKGNGARNIHFVPKIDNLPFAAILANRDPHIHPILCKISVRISKEEFSAWVQAAYLQGIRHIVVVGGSSQTVRVGYSVNEAVQYIKKNFPDIYVGGIMIFTRPNETKRMIDKMKSGVDFFLSQIIFETGNLKQVILDLARQAAAENLSMPHLYISISPASRIKDIEFMRWLGVEFPSAVQSYLIEGGEQLVEPRTFEVVERVCEEITHFMEKEQIELRFNIEHLMYSNFGLAEKLLSRIKNMVNQ